MDNADKQAAKPAENTNKFIFPKSANPSVIAHGLIEFEQLNNRREAITDNYMLFKEQYEKIRFLKSLEDATAMVEKYLDAIKDYVGKHEQELNRMKTKVIPMLLAGYDDSGNVVSENACAPSAKLKAYGMVKTFWEKFSGIGVTGWPNNNLPKSDCKCGSLPSAIRSMDADIGLKFNEVENNLTPIY